MKKLMIPVMMLFMVNVDASIEHEGDQNDPTPQEISRNRACFEELSKNGCGDPGEDIQQFRSCLHNVFPTLNSHCQSMMKELYIKK